MDNKTRPEPVELADEEEVQRREGQALFEMTRTSGFEVLRKKLEDLGFHSWIDPREAADKAEWEWRELNGFHAANNARELLEWIKKAISTAEYLEKKRNGEVGARPMKLE